MTAKPTYEELENRVRELEEEKSAWKREEMALQDLELHSRALSDASFEAIFLSEEGVCLYQNKSAERMFGYTLDEAVGRHGTEWIVPEHREMVKNNMLSGNEKPYEVTALRKDGTTFPCEIQARMMDDQGRSVRITVLRDLSERTRVKEEVKVSDRRFRELAENIHEVFWIFDWREQRMQYVNAAYEEVWGRSAQALLENYKEWAESIHPDDREYAKESFLRIVESGEGENREYRIIRPGGGVRWVSDRGFAISGKDGKVHRIVGIAEDITSQKNAEQELRISEEKFSKAFHSSPDAIIISRMRDGLIMEVNEGFERTTGYRRNELIGQTTLDLGMWVDPNDRQSYVKMIAEKGRMRESEYRFRVKSGEVRDGLLSGETIQIGPQKCLVGIIRDITERRLTENALRKSEEKFRTLVEESPLGIASIGEDGHYRYINLRFEELFGYTIDDISTGQKWFKKAYPDDIYRKEVIKIWIEDQKQTKVGQAQPRSFTVTCKDNSQKKILFRAVTLGTQGQFVIYEDITDRKQAEEALRESEEKLRNIVEHSTNLFFSHTLDHELTFLSPQSRDFFQCDPEEAMIRWTEFATDNPINAKGFALTEKAIKTGKRQPSYELELEGKEGRKVWVEVNEAPVKKNDKTVAIVGSLTDITERKGAEEELIESHQTFLTVLDGIDATIYVADMDTYEILFMNKHMIDVFKGDLNGQICYEVFRNENNPCSHCTNDRLVDAEGNPLGVCTWETKNPITEKWYINYDRAIRWVDGRIVRLQIATDITRIKELEQDRIQTEMQLRQAQKMESVGRLAGGVAHDFNNMLGVIIGHAELAMEQVGPSLPVHDDLKEIYTAARRSANLTRQLLAFARKQTILPKVLDLNDTVKGMLKMLRRLIGEDIDLTWKPGTNLWTIKIDPAQIDQILANLCVNARDAITGTGKIAIETENVVLNQADCIEREGLVPGEYVMLVVRDDGCGIDKKTLDKLFEPFFTTKGVGEGTGLGLSTVYGIVKQNDGYVYAHSKRGEGAIFKVYFPRTLEIAEATGESVDKTVKKGTETVLLVEDEPSFLRLGKTVLERFGYKLLAAHSPSEALSLAEAHEGPIHLLITDVVMPEMNGKDLMTRIKKLNPKIKVLFMSGYTPNAIVHRGIIEDGIDFLPKPFSVNSLATKVRNCLDEQG